MEMVSIYMDAYLKILKEHHLKLTPRRKAVIQLFLKAGRRLGPLDVHGKLAKKVSSLGLPTVYRILDEMCGSGVLNRVASGDRQLYYTLNKAPHDHRHHFVCRRCNRVEEVQGCAFDKTALVIEKKLGCKVESHLFQLEGLCAKCV